MMKSNIELQRAKKMVAKGKKHFYKLQTAISVFAGIFMAFFHVLLDVATSDKHFALTDVVRELPVSILVMFLVGLLTTEITWNRMMKLVKESELSQEKLG